MDTDRRPRYRTGARTTFVLVIWSELHGEDPPIWRGALETGSGERKYFASLQALAGLLGALGGWVDWPDTQPPPGGEPPN